MFSVRKGLIGFKEVKYDSHAPSLVGVSLTFHFEIYDVFRTGFQVAEKDSRVLVLAASWCCVRISLGTSVWTEEGAELCSS